MPALRLGAGTRHQRRRVSLESSASFPRCPHYVRSYFNSGAKADIAEGQGRARRRSSPASDECVPERFHVSRLTLSRTYCSITEPPLVRLNSSHLASSRAHGVPCCSKLSRNVAFRAVHERCGINAETSFQIVSGKAEPLFLRDIGQLGSFLWAAILHSGEVLQMIDHLVHQN